MPIRVQYCDKCGIRIEPKDIKQQRAAFIDGSWFCPKCYEVLKQTKAARPDLTAKPPSDYQPSWRLRFASKRVQTTADKPMKAIARRPTTKRFSRQTHDEFDYDVKKRKRKKSHPLLFMLGSVIVSAAVIVAIVLFSSKTGRKPDFEPDAMEPPASTSHKPDEKEEPVQSPQPVKEKTDPRMSRLRQQLQDVLDYGKEHPKEYVEVLEKLHTLGRERNLPAELDRNLVAAVEEWETKWDKAARAELERLITVSSQLEEEGKFDEAIILWENAAEGLLSLVEYKKQTEKQIERIESLKKAVEEAAKKEEETEEEEEEEEDEEEDDSEDKREDEDE